jgi:hypothetical protein
MRKVEKVEKEGGGGKRERERKSKRQLHTPGTLLPGLMDTGNCVGLWVISRVEANKGSFPMLVIKHGSQAHTYFW